MKDLNAPFDAIVVPLDGGRRAEQVMPLAVREARLHGAPLVALRVVPFTEPPPGHPSHGPEPYCAPDRPDEIGDACDEAERYLAGLLERHGVADTRVIVRYGDPFTQIAAELARWQNPLVIVSAVATAVLPAGAHSALARRIGDLNRYSTLLVPLGDVN
jgi:nucleotide-binding universal stress UspA family protein